MKMVLTFFVKVFPSLAVGSAVSCTYICDCPLAGPVFDVVIVLDVRVKCVVVF